MNKADLKPYAPKAIKNFITADTACANLLGRNPMHAQIEIGTNS